MTGGLEKLVEKFFDFIKLFQFWFVVRPNENAIVFRVGKIHRVITEPGGYWKRWFNVDTVEKQSMATDTILWKGQMILTKDGVQMGAAAVITWRISDIGKFLMEVEDGDQAIIEISQPALLEMFKELTWAEVVELPAQALNQKLTAAVRARQPGRWGVRVESVALSELGRLRGLRLLQ